MRLTIAKLLASLASHPLWAAALGFEETKMSNELTVYKEKTPTDYKLSVGDEIKVGEFFWIPESSYIGLDLDARHGNKRSIGGSVDEDCTLKIRGFIDEHTVVVRLERPRLPKGSRAPIGTVFSMPLDVIHTWPEKRRKLEEQEQKRAALAERFLR